jgi:hypothetical protein
VFEEPVKASGEVALAQSGRVAWCFAFGGAARDLVLGRFLVLAAMYDDGVQGTVELSVAAAAESVPCCLAAGVLAGLLPNARLTIYADSAHGFLFQHHSQFATDVNAFLDETT